MEHTFLDRIIVTTVAAKNVVIAYVQFYGLCRVSVLCMGLVCVVCAILKGVTARPTGSAVTPPP